MKTLLVAIVALGVGYCAGSRPTSAVSADSLLADSAYCPIKIHNPDGTIEEYRVHTVYIGNDYRHVSDIPAPDARGIELSDGRMTLHAVVVR